MLKISIIEARHERRLVVEGKLIAPWTAEFKHVCDHASENLEDRQLVIDMKNVTAISDEGGNVLFPLMNKGVKFRYCGVFTKQVFRQLARRVRRELSKTGK